ncbi:SDR family oxidoreductase [Mongoliimonas terrestris]|uniref:SDR family oxidoreductase n=1 Tax=Mongoliimonas terrestris TaxID=1709001 RepID=UPI000949681F|nr:SDR family oxidoreductase [Mongoliimonas terrestris]
MSAPRTLLVTGANGHLGRLVLEDLLARDSGDRIVAASRDPSRLADLAARGVETRRADFDDPASLASAFAGVDRLLLVSTDMLAVSGQRLAQHQAAVTAAAEAGVGHLVYTSMPQPDPASPVSFAGDHRGTEAAIVASGLSHTILRNHWYFENLFGSIGQKLASGAWYSAAGDGRLADVSRADCARVAAAVLAGTQTGATVEEISGPEALTTAEIAALIAEVSGRPLAVIPVPDDALRATLVDAGLPSFVVDLIVTFDINTRMGRAGTVTDAVERLTGRKPEALRDVLLANRAALADGAPAAAH